MEDASLKAELSAGAMPGNRSGDTGQAELDFSDVRGQDDLIEAIVLGAAGGHNILMIGEPGCGKTMIAQRIPTILLRMTEKEALEVTMIHSISGLLDAGAGLMWERPFRAPHHNVSLNALIGGGSYAQPGEVSLAHNGVLFLDEIAEFSRSTLDSLRQPMEDKRVTISRVNETNTYPANFMFVTAMNACSSLHNRGPADQWLCGICWNCRRKTVHSGGKEQVNRSCFGGCERRESSHQRNGEGN